jgi:hypothetical protein
MEALREAAMLGFEAGEKSGHEICGVLYGRSRESGWRIEGWRPVVREDPARPAVPLSGAESAWAESLVRDWMSDLELRSFRPIGWFRSRTRGMAALSPEDAQVCERLFGEAGCLALILRPSTQRPMTAAFFAFAPGGERESSERGVSLALERPAAVATERAEEKEAVPEATVAAEPARATLGSALAEAPRRGRRWAALATLLAAFVFSALGCFLWLDRPVRLDAGLSGDSVAIRWNRSVGFLSGAAGAELSVNREAVELPLDGLRSGGYNLPGPPRDLRLRLRVRGRNAASQDETIAIVAPSAK